MEPERISLTEWQTTPGVPLSPAQRDILLEHRIGVGPTSGVEGRYDLTPGSEIGALELPGLSVRILPKLPIERVFFLVSYALDGLKGAEAATDFAEEPDLFEAVVAAFAAHVRSAFRPGLLQGYRTEEDALMTVRGRILFERQLRRFGIAPPIDVRFDDFTIDIEENRLIKAALTRLGKMRLRSDRSRRHLRSFALSLAAVEMVEYGHQLPSITFNRLNERYRPALALARLILRSTSYDIERGTVTSPSFLIDMNRVFEDFVVQALRDELRLGAIEFPQGAKGRRLTLDTAGRISLKPDISWWRGGRCVFVGDVKYKKTADWRIPNADLYQLHAYTTATDLPGGLLIYAAGEGEPGTHVVRHADKRLTVMAVDLAGDPDVVLAGISRVADQIRGLMRMPNISLRKANKDETDAVVLKRPVIARTSARCKSLPNGGQ